MIILGIIGILCLVYYLACVIYAGIRSSYLWLWLAGGLLCLAGALFLYYGEKQNMVWDIPFAVKIVLLLAAAAILLCFAVVEARILEQADKRIMPNLDYIIVLGAQVKKKGPSRALQHRIDTAYDYLCTNGGTTAVLSGGRGADEPETEASCMARALESRGISPKRLICEEKSVNTDENFKYSMSLIEEEDASIGVVTNNFHLYRAIAIGEKQWGRKVYGIAAPSHSIMQLHYLVREFLAIIKDTLTGHMDW